MLKQIVIAAGSIVVATAAYAARTSQPAVSLPVDRIVAARQASFDMSAMTMAELRLAMKDQLDLKKQAYVANTLARWAAVLPAMFPAGTGPGSGSATNRARPDIWTDRAGFERAAADFAAAANNLAAAARAGDATGVEEQFGAVDRSCSSCHYDYKSE